MLRSVADRLRPTLAAHPLAVSAGVGLVLAALALAWVVPFYASYDDPAMSMIVSGTGFADAPDEHLIFSNVALGRALRWLYVRHPAVPWYGLHLLGLQVLAAIALLYAGLRVAPGACTVLLFVVYFAVAILDFLTRVQFTSAAFVASQAGVLLVLSLRVPPAGGRGAWLAIGGAGTLLVVAGALVRFEAFALAAALALPTAIVLTRGADRKTVAAIGGVLTAAALAALALRAYDRAYYQRDERWRAFRAFNEAVRPVMDYGQANDYTPQTAAVFRAVGWSRTDHRLLLEWFHPDDGVFTAAKLEAVLAAEPLSVRHRPAARLWRQLARMAGDRSALALLLALALFIAARAGEPRGHRALLAAAATSTVVLLWLVLFRKAPPQVYLPILSFPAAAAVCISGRPWGGRKTAWVAGAMALAACVGSLAGAGYVSRQAAAYRRVSLRSLFALQSPPRLIVAWATDFPFDAIAPLDPPSAIAGLRLFSTGWPQRTPVAQRALARFGARDVLEALAWREDVVLAAPRWILPSLTRYARRHRGWELHFAAEPDVPGLSLFRVAEARVVAPAADADGLEEAP